MLSVRSVRRRRLTHVMTLALVLTQAQAGFPQSTSSPTAAVPSASVAPVASPTPRPSRTPAARVVPNRKVPTVTPPNLEVRFGDAPSAADISRARVFPEVLRATGLTDAAENRAVARALEQFADAPDRQQALDGLEAFAEGREAGAWQASLLANVATMRDQSGFYSRAAHLWDAAWELARFDQSPDAKAVADYAIGKRLVQASSFGQVAVLESRLKELEGRPVRGTALHDVRVARESRDFLVYHHDEAIFSGPEALKVVLGATNRASRAALSVIAAYRPPHEGTSLKALLELARGAGVALHMRHVNTAEELPLPSVVHLKSEHYSALVAREPGGYRLRDVALGGDIFLSEAALHDEMSGYVLVAADAGGTVGRSVADGEAERIVGRCLAGSPQDDDPCGCGDAPPPGMPVYTLHPMTAAVLVNDTPLQYAPPRGPAVSFHLRYNDRRGTFSDFGHTGASWRHDWLAYVTDNNTTVVMPYSWTQVTLRGEGTENYNPYTGSVNWRTRAALVQVTHDPPRYERTLPDGTVEVYAFPDRAATAPNRRVFLTEVIDPQGQTVTLTYDENVRLVAVTDALGQVTTLAYDDPADPLRLTRVTDPFGRSAALAYNVLGQLASVTDALGMTSRFAYDESDAMRAMTTPYGTTQFRQEDTTGVSAHRVIVVTDPEGGTERLEYWPTSAVDLPATAPSGDVPAGFSDMNQQLDLYTSLYWSKLAMADAPGDRSRAVITRWLVKTNVGYSAHATTRSIPHSIKGPLESRIWYRYPDQVNHATPGDGAKPSQMARVLSGGGTQLKTFTYNTKGMITSQTDPLGRQTTYTYAANGVDLTEVRQVTASGTDLLATYADYDARHRPGTTTDAAGETTTTVYNTAGQIASITNAKSETTTYAYSTPDGYLTSVTGPVTGATTSYTYDSQGRVQTVTNADGYTVTTAYDALNRVVTRTYPDDTEETHTYERLDLVEETDRLGRATRHFYDRAGRRTATRDPLGRVIRQEWCGCGSLLALVDANGHRTSWTRDALGRVTAETRADGTTQTTYTYDATGRLATVTDPKEQVTTHTYLTDDSLSSTTYTNATIATPSVSYTYDAVYPRVATMVDGIGTTTYAYKSAGQLGAGQVATVDGPLTNDVIAYTYDELGRVVTRTINGAANSVTWAFDALGRVTSEQNVLGTFTYTYDGVTSRLGTVSYPNGQTSTYSYLPTAQDHRLQTIHHRYPNLATLSKFDYTYDAVGNILTWRQQADSTATLWSYGYDAADQLTRAVQWSTDPTPAVLKRYAYTYDPAGNRTSEQIDDAITMATHDGLNRLVSQAPGGAITVAGAVNEPATVRIQGQSASVDPAGTFRGAAPTTIGANTFGITATDASGNVTTQEYQLNQSGSASAFTHDDNGNMTSDGTLIFEWDAKNQLAATQHGTRRETYSYDGQQRRVRQVVTENGGVVADSHFLWCGLEICEDRSSGQTAVRMFFRQGTHAGTTDIYYALDHLESIRDITDASVTRIGRYDYDPYGRRTVTGSIGIDERGFTGQVPHLSAAIGLTLFRAYSADAGRWLSEDPAGLAAGPNLYAYVSGQTVRAIDPLGLQAISSGGPSDVAPPGCNASPWVPYKVTSTNRSISRSWRLMSEHHVEVVVPWAWSDVSLGFCVCTWKTVGFIDTMNTTTYYQRNVTCCGHSTTERTQRDKATYYDVPVIGGRTAVTKVPYTGVCNCESNPPSSTP